MIYATPTLPDELYHHGIKGMKWGIRRYQNEDGSYTEAGRKRYGMNLDINDRSRKNVAKIRLGEARRRLDVAKENAKTTNNSYRVAQTQERVRAAKRAVRDSKKIDKGAKLAAKGRTISTESGMMAGMLGLTVNVGRLAAMIYCKKLGDDDILAKVKIAKTFEKAIAGSGKEKTNAILKIVGPVAVAALVGGHTIKKASNINNLRAYNKASWNGTATIKGIGSEEYAAVKERSKRK